MRRANPDLRAAEERRRMNNANAVAAFVARRNEIGEIGKVKHPRLKARCKYDLALFGTLYCKDLLDHPPSADLKNTLIRDVQECVLNGGQIAELFGRGTGKTTWVVIIAAVWALLYGHRKYIITIGASLNAARKNLKTIKLLLSRSDAILADFPSIAASIRHINGVPQRAQAQTYNGVNTQLDWQVETITLPTMLDEHGEPLEAGCGGILSVAGVGTAIRGSNIAGRRPDMCLLDDCQSRKDATSPKRVEGILEFIHSDVLGLSSHGKALACFVTITPQKPGDVAMEISNPSKYPEWSVKIQPFVKKLPKNWDQLVELFAERFAADAANKDFKRSQSTAWYKTNQDLFADLEVLDPEQFDKEREVDAKHHILNLRSGLGRQSFNAEYMMIVEEAGSVLTISADKVSSNLTGAPRLVCPPGTDTVVGFCDINVQAGAGLSWALVAFGPKRVAAVIDYGRYPSDGTPLVPPNASSTMRSRRVAAAIRHIVEVIAAKKIRDTRGHAVRIRAFGFDRGWLPDVVHRTLYVIRKSIAVGFPLVSARGFPWNKFGTRKGDLLRRGDHIFATRSKYGEYLAYMAPYWREIMQSALLEGPLTPGSLSIFGRDPKEHYRFAMEIVAEKLVRKYTAYVGKELVTAWDWTTTGAEHWCDAVTCCFALASWYHAFDALSSTIDEAALGVKQPEEYNGETDETEGTLDTSTPRTEDDGDLEAAMEDGEEKDPLSPIPMRRIPMQNQPPKMRVVKRVISRFKLGKYKK